MSAKSFLFMDSCDHYDQTSYIGLKWNVLGIGTSSTSAGRNGRGIQFNNSGGLGKSCPHNSSWVFGWAINIGNTEGAFGEGSFYQASHAGDTTLFTIFSEGDGSVSIYAGNGRTTLIANSGSSGLFLKSGVWYWFDCKFEITGTTPMSITATFRVNTQVWCTGSGSTGINVSSLLLQTATTNFHQFFNPSGVTSIDDIAIFPIDGTGSVNDFFGDTMLSVLFPRADVTANWTAVGGSTSTMWDHVNDQFAEANDDTIYIKSDTAGQDANMQWQPVSVPAGGSIIAVHYGVLARKDAEGSRSFEQTVGPTGGFLQLGPTWFPGDSYAYYFFGMDQDPNTGAPWTATGFDGTDFGVQLVS